MTDAALFPVRSTEFVPRHRHRDVGRIEVRYSGCSYAGSLTCNVDCMALLLRAGQEHALTEDKQHAVPLAQRQVTRGRIVSAAQVAAEPCDQSDCFTEVVRLLESVFFA